MKNLNLDAYQVEELDEKQLLTTEGGSLVPWALFALSQFFVIYDNSDKVSSSFADGYAAGSNAIK